MNSQAPAEPGHSDARIPPREQCVLRYALEHFAQHTPDKVYCVFDDGTTWTYAQTLERTRSRAAALQKAGVTQEEHVLAWMPNGAESLLTFFAVNYIGAVFVPINTAYRGELLAHVVDNANASVMVAHGELLPRLAEISTGGLHTVITVSVAAPVLNALTTTDFTALETESAPEPPARCIEPWDTQAVIYTSGTTGPSKGVLVSYLHLYSNAGPETWPFVTGEDRFLINMPIYHIGGLGLPFVMLVRGGSIALWRDFKTDEFWDFVRRTECSVVFLLGVMASFLSKQPPAASDRQHPVRLALVVPFTPEAAKLHERFGLDVYTIFNMTEISSPIVSAPNPSTLGTCGKLRTNVEVRLVDDNDCEVSTGAVGEMLVRTDRPWAMTKGYLNNPQATARAWRNGWFHTGDAFRRDAQGNYFFVDRIKDAIRRRGENISSFEVEAAITAHPDVAEAAAIAVSGEYGEDEVMAVIAPISGRRVEPAELIEFLVDRLAYFMIPRYLRVVTELPKTPTAKVQKVMLRQAGITADTWDREAAGVKLKRERFNS